MFHGRPPSTREMSAGCQKIAVGESFLVFSSVFMPSAHATLSARFPGGSFFTCLESLHLIWQRVEGLSGFICSLRFQETLVCRGC